MPSVLSLSQPVVISSFNSPSSSVTPSTSPSVLSHLQPTAVSLNSSSTSSISYSSLTPPGPSSSSSSTLEPLVMFKDDHSLVAMGFVQSTRRALHGCVIPPGYDCVLVKWIKCNGTPAPLPLGDIDENSVQVNQYFALPTSSLAKVLVTRRKS